VRDWRRAGRGPAPTTATHKQCVGRGCSKQRPYIERERLRILLGTYFCGLICGGGLGDLVRGWARAANPCLQAVHVEIDDGSGEEREHLADD
jgi:hypothetical protein